MKLEREHKIYQAIPMLLFVLFALLLMGLTTMGAKAYQHLEAQSERIFDQTTFEDYIRTKVRSTDAVDGVRVGTYGDSAALYLRDSDLEGEECYETVLYYYDGSLMELYKEACTDIAPGTGTKILSCSDYTVEKISDQEIRCGLMVDGSWQYVTVAVRSGVAEE